MQHWKRLPHKFYARHSKTYYLTYGQARGSPVILSHKTVNPKITRNILHQDALSLRVEPVFWNERKFWILGMGKTE